VNSSTEGNESADSVKGSPRSLSERVTHVRIAESCPTLRETINAKKKRTNAEKKKLESLRDWNVDADGFPSICSE
jgi:hypothetical protein